MRPPVARTGPKAEEPMRKTLCMAVLLGLAVTPFMAAAQAPAKQAPAAPQTDVPTVPPDQQATKEQIARLLEAMHLRKQFDNSMAIISAVMQQQMHAHMQAVLAKEPEARRPTPEQQAALEKLTDKYMQKAMHIYPTDELLDDAAKVYRRHMTRSDVEAYIAFYNSPPGQHLLEEQPVMMKEIMTMAMQRVQEHSQELYKDMAKDLKDYLATQKSSGAAPAKSKQ